MDHQEGWMPKNWCFWTAVLEETLDRPLDCKEIHRVHPKRDPSWIFIRRSDAKAEYFGHLMWKTDSLEKTLLLGKIVGRRRKGNRGRDGWMASPTRWIWLWASSGRWWWTGNPGVLQSMGSKKSWACHSRWTTSTWLVPPWCPHSFLSQHYRFSTQWYFNPGILLGETVRAWSERRFPMTSTSTPRRRPLPRALSEWTCYLPGVFLVQLAITTMGGSFLFCSPT